MCSESIQHLQIFIPNTPRTRRMFPERFPYIPYAPRMLPKCFQNSGHVHVKWTTGILVPLFKKKRQRHHTSYSCFSKVVTNILKKRISTWINDIVSDAHYGLMACTCNSS